MSFYTIGVFLLSLAGLILAGFQYKNRIRTEVKEIEKLSLIEEDLEEDQNLKRIAFSVGGVSMVSWLAAFAFAMVKDLSNFTYIQMLIPYLILVFAAIGGGQFIKKKMEKEVIEESKA